MNYDELLLATLSQDAFYQVNKTLVKKIGIVPAIVLSFLMDKKKYFTLTNQLDKNGGFFLSAKKANQENKKTNLNIVEFELGIGEVARRSSFRLLTQKGLIEIKKIGHPARHFYYLNSENILDLLTSSPTQSHATSPTQVDTSSPTQSHATYNNNKEQKQTIKTNIPILEIKEHSSLSYMNIKSKFAEKLTSKGIKYVESRREYKAISEMQDFNIQPNELLELVDILIQVKRDNPNDKFIQGICFTMSDLVSYRAKIYNAQSKPGQAETKNGYTREMRDEILRNRNYDVWAQKEIVITR